MHMVHKPYHEHERDQTRLRPVNGYNQILASCKHTYKSKYIAATSIITFLLIQVVDRHAHIDYVSLESKTA